MSVIKYLFDGAFGTYYSKLTRRTEPCEYANINDASTVIKIHHEYITGGANAIKTNTFGANSNLNCESDTVDQIIRKGYELAVEAVGIADVAIFADIGPVSADTTAQASSELIDIAGKFVALGADKFLFETHAEYEPVAAAVRFIKTKLPDSYVIVSFAVGQDGYTNTGKYYKKLLELADSNADIDACGLNCICGPLHLLQLMTDVKVNKTLSVMPNSGYPEIVGNRIMYLDNAHYFAKKLKSIIMCGASIVGGCCGTTPHHIAATRKMLDRIESEEGANGIKLPSAKQEQVDTDSVIGQSYVNTFAERLMRGDKVVAVELETPVGYDMTHLRASSQILKNAGVDAVTIADSPLSRTRADTFLTAAKLKQDVDISVLPHITCRDRNIIAIKAALLGGKLNGLNNVFVITGDPIAKTDRGSAKGVFDFNSAGLIEYIDSLNDNVFGAEPYLIGAALNLNAVRFGDELKRAVRKAEKGAKYFMTQPIFNTQGLDNLKLAYKELGAKVLLGIMPLVSHRNAVFLNNEVPGIRIPDETVAGLEGKSPEETYQLSVDFCKDIVDKAYDYCDGFYIITQLKRSDMAKALTEYIKAKQ